MNMERIADLLFEAHMLQALPRSGYAFLGAGQESVAEHTYSTAFIALILSKLEPEADPARLLSMCLVHDLPEARIGDLNHVQKRYVSPDENRAMADTVAGIPFGNDLQVLLSEFNAGTSLEAHLARDADQLSLALNLKALQDLGHASPAKWIERLKGRLKTTPGKKLLASILDRPRDAWWRDRPNQAPDRSPQGSPMPSG